MVSNESGRLCRDAELRPYASPAQRFGNPEPGTVVNSPSNSPYFLQLSTGVNFVPGGKKVLSVGVSVGGLMNFFATSTLT